MIRLRSTALPLLILVVGIVASLVLAAGLGRIKSERDQARFNGLVTSAVQTIRARMESHIALLRSTAGLYASNKVVTPAMFHAYAERLDLSINYPGVLGIGYGRYLQKKSDVTAMEAWMRREGGDPGFRVWPAGERPDYSTIVALHPDNRRNRVAIGYDMLSETTRRAAAMQAARTGQIAVTGVVQLVQEISPIKQPGFLLYMPVYANIAAEKALPPAQRTLRGWAYSPLRAGDMFGALFGTFHQREESIAIYDNSVADGNLLFSTGSFSPGARYQRIEPMEIGGRRWMVRISSTPFFEQNAIITLPHLAAGAGIVATLLLVAIFAVQARAVTRTERDVRTRTAELSDTNQHLQREIMSRRKMEAILQQMQKMDAIGQLTGGIAHDFNNMLAIIVGSLDLAKLRINDPKRVLPLLDQAMDGARRATALTQRLLAFARRQTLAPQVIDANHLVSSMSDMLSRSLGETIRLELNRSPASCTLLADPGQLEQAILNLAINARDAMPDGGVLSITVDTVMLDAAYGRAHPDATPGPHVRITIRDTGFGMSPETLEKAIEPFFSTKDVGKGTGLGLSQVFGFVRQSGGHLVLVSAPGEGTTATIHLPAHASDDTSLQARDVPQLQPSAGRPHEKILVVEDDESVRTMSVNLLRDLGYTVFEAHNGREALELMKNGGPIDLLFTDVVMPDMNGVELAAEALRLVPAPRLLFTSGYAPAGTLSEMLARTGADLLPKPFAIEQLASRIRACLDAPAMSDS